MADGRGIGVRVVLAEPTCQQVVSLRLPEGTTVAEAVSASGLLAGLAAPERDGLAYGIYGRVVDGVRALEEGDRVEILRPLPQDPKSRRRARARKGLTMGARARPGRD